MPLVYATAAATVLAWVLVVLLTVTPRTFYHSSAAASAMSFASGRSFLLPRGSGSGGFIGVGSRPWLQKAAALTVAIALTIATADTFKLSRQTYLTGLPEGDSLRQNVVSTIEIRAIRTVSNIFVWLAQVQTLIRLFPRHREKVLIKWIGFGLVIIDIVFSCLNSFLVDVHRRPRHFDDAIAALNYLFQLAVGLLYAAWVLYYSFGKRRYAYWHWKMKNISLIALLSIVSILTPVVFFVTDIACPEVAGWGDYFRWVGAAAASVVVWEWVERIEALERDEKKDDILGREIFDADDALDAERSAEMVYFRRRNDQYVISGSVEKQSLRKGGHDSDSGSGGIGPGGTGVRETIRRLGPSRWASRHESGSEIPSRRSSTRAPSRLQPIVATGGDLAEAPTSTSLVPRPPRSPVNRADTTSAASTVYIVRHDHPSNAPWPVRMLPGTTPEPHIREESLSDLQKTTAVNAPPAISEATKPWHHVPNPFKRKRTAPPAQIQAVLVHESHADRSKEGPPTRAVVRPKVSTRLGIETAKTIYRRRLERAAQKDEDDTPWIVIPAQPRGAAAWSPSQDLHSVANVQSAAEAQATARANTASPLREVTHTPPAGEIQGPLAVEAEHGHSTGDDTATRINDDNDVHEQRGT